MLQRTLFTIVLSNSSTAQLNRSRPCGELLRTISEDKKTYTFNLRKGVKFHQTKYFTPSREFNADDVLFSFNRQFNKSHPYHLVGGGNYQYWEGWECLFELIKSIEKVNDYQVKITLTKPNAPLLANLAMSFMSILSKEYGDQLSPQKSKIKLIHTRLVLCRLFIRNIERIH